MKLITIAMRASILGLLLLNQACAEGLVVKVSEETKVLVGLDADGNSTIVYGIVTNENGALEAVVLSSKCVLCTSEIEEQYFLDDYCKEPKKGVTPPAICPGSRDTTVKDVGSIKLMQTVKSPPCLWVLEQHGRVIAAYPPGCER